MTYEEIMKHDVIWGFMYGQPYINTYCKDGVIKQEPDCLIDIETSKLDWTKDRTAFYYIWGWPGPDSNRYALNDYKKTWCFSPEEMPNAKIYKYEPMPKGKATFTTYIEIE